MKRLSFLLVWVLTAFVAPRSFTATVSTLADSGPGSLREAIAAGGTVDFAVTGTITLTSGELAINGPLTINGPGAAQLTVQRNTAAGTPEFRVLRVQSGSVTISGLTIRNGLVGAIYGNGGGILNEGSLTLNDCVVSGNRSTGEYTRGTGTFNGSNATLIANRCVFADNAGAGEYSEGGGLYVFGEVTLNDSTVSGNNGGGFYSRGGGMHVDYFGTGHVARCTFSGNSVAGANAQGGGIYNYGTLQIINSTLSGNNSGGSGGGIHVDSLSLGTAIGNCTISGNAAPEGSGIYNNGFEPGHLARITVRDSIVAGNLSQDIENNGTIISEGHNLLGLSIGHAITLSAGDQSGVSAATLKLGPLAENGGPTRTRALLTGSPAIDAGSETGFPATDQRGMPRPFGPRADIGAFEGDQPPPPNQPPTVRIVNPREGETFTAPANILVMTSVHDEDGLAAEASVEFFDGANRVGVGQLTDPGPPHDAAFRFSWTNVSAGEYALTARATDDRGAQTTSSPVKIIVGSEQPVVSISGLSTVLEFCPPNADCAGISFSLRRTGPGLDRPLTVFLRYRGTASSGVDYQALPVQVAFEAGRDLASVTSIPIDDTLYEGDETIIAEIIAGLDYRTDPNRWQATTVIRDNDAPARPVVSLELVDADAAETLITQNNIDWAEFRVRRTGPVASDLLVSLNTQQGSARLGEDYRLDGVNNEFTVRIPAGASSVNVRLYPIDDAVYEGDETVFGHLIPPPPMGDPPYQIDFEHSSVAMVIHDNDPITTRLEITSPLDGQQFQPGDTIELRTQIIGPGSDQSWSVEFFDGDQHLGTTRPGAPIWWQDASGGQHVINARAHDPSGIPGQDTLVAQPVTIQVGPGAALPVVKIGVTPWRTGEPCPTCFVVPSVLTIERTAPTNTALTVFIAIDGTATAGDDYQALPASVEIPAGQRSAQLTLLARDDQLAEGPEIVRVRVLPQPPPLLPPTYFVSAYAKEALIVISDDEAGAPQARLDIVSPANGSHLRFPSTIELSALAVYMQNEVYGPVEFYAGDQLVARSLVTATTQPAIPGLPSVHTAYWTNPPVGQYVLTARTRLSFSQSITSPPVNVTVDSPTMPVVRLETLPLQNALAREFCPPNMDCAYPSFAVRRGGPTNADLRVYLSYSGTATAGADYPSLPGSLVIPAGQDAAFLMLVPKDDTLVEGPETVVARFTPVPGPGYIQDPNHASAAITIVDNERPLDTFVSIAATQRIAEESSEPFRRMNLIGEFTIRRTGPTNNSQSVFVQYSGMATLGVDYPSLPRLATIPAGASSTVIRVEAINDRVPEGIETLVATLAHCGPGIDPPTGILCIDGFIIDPAHTSATVFIRDDGLTEASLVITKPGDGASFPPGQTILIEATAIDLDGYINRAEFWDGEQRIGVSEIVFIRAPDPGTPIQHSFEWRAAAQGPHVLTARASRADGTQLKSTPVRISVGGDPFPTVVRIEATSRIAEEDSKPLERLALVGEFTISRSGPTNFASSVFVHYSGTATPGVDYPSLPWIVTIPAGAVTTTIKIIPNNDGIPEGIETLVATLSDCPPATDPPLGVSCVAVEIDAAHPSATVFIRDDGLTRASLVITRPKDGDGFHVGEAIPIEATAIALDADYINYLNCVEFWDGEHQIGESRFDFFRAPFLGEPVHHNFLWVGASQGPHVLTARLCGPPTEVRSSPVRIVVGSVGNQPPAAAIIRPAKGAEFPPDTPIEIVAETRDPDGYVQKVEFFADGRKIGERNVAFIQPPEPGQVQTFTFVWNQTTPGRRVLTAHATDNHNAVTLSAAVEINVMIPDQLPIVAVVASDSFAVEPVTNIDLNAAVFRIRRFGPTNAPLLVAYSLQGTAQNGVDYETLSGSVVIPAGQKSANVIVRPLPDNLSEPLESVLLRLEDPPGEQPPTYHVGRRRHAAAVISDSDPASVHPAWGARCVGLPGGLLSLCFPAQTGQNFRVEASSDLRNWETVFDTPAIDGALDFVDDEATNLPHRFYRLAPEPVTLADD